MHRFTANRCTADQAAQCRQTLASLPGFEDCICHLLAGEPWTSHWTFCALVSSCAKLGYLSRGFCWGQNELIYTEHFGKVPGICCLSSYIQYQPHSFYKLQSIPLPNCNIISFSEEHLLCWLFRSFAIINNVSVNILWNRGIFYHDHQIKLIPYLTFVCNTDDLNTF